MNKTMDAQKLVAKFWSLIGEGKRFTTKAEAARAFGLPASQATKFFDFLDGKDTRYLTVLDWLEKIGGNIVFPDQDIFAVEEEMRKKSLTVLQVYAKAGAGAALEEEEGEPIFNIAVPEQYLRPHISTLLIAGESMEPTILDRAVVGVNRESGAIIQGKIYAVRLPYEGVVVKRLFLDHREKCFVLRSDNKGGDYPDIKLPFEEGDAFVYGRVVWVLQSYEKIAI